MRRSMQYSDKRHSWLRKKLVTFGYKFTDFYNALMEVLNKLCLILTFLAIPVLLGFLAYNLFVCYNFYRVISIAITLWIVQHTNSHLLGR